MSSWNEVPMRSSWDGYGGTHILEAGVDEFMRRITDLGYEGQWRPHGEGIIAEFDRC